MKIQHSFKLSDKVAKALTKLAEIPTYGSKTGVIEALVWEKALELSIAKSVVGNRNNHGNVKVTTTR